jgi:hypothetical protein
MEKKALNTEHSAKYGNYGQNSANSAKYGKNSANSAKVKNAY